MQDRARAARLDAQALAFCSLLAAGPGDVLLPLLLLCRIRGERTEHVFCPPSKPEAEAGWAQRCPRQQGTAGGQFNVLQAQKDSEAAILQVLTVAQGGETSHLCPVASPKSQPPLEHRHRFLNCFLNFVTLLLLAVA